jgi:predicted SAM-dependent methyltransferase
VSLNTQKQGYPHMPTIVMGIPLSGRPLPPRLMFAFHNVSPPMNTNLIMYNTVGMPIDQARNHFAERAIEQDAKYLFFWDEDVEMPQQTLRELVYQMEHRPDAGVCGGIYCLKSDRPEPLVFKGVGAGPYWDWKVGEIFECSGLGMGCTLIRVEMLKDLPKPWFKSVDDCSAYLDNIRYGEQWTEDLYFCHKVTQSKKWKIIAHGQLLPAHINLSTGQEFVLPPDSKPMRALTMHAGKKKCLDVGCGEQPMKTDEGQVVTVDIREDCHPDYRCDFRRLPFAAGSFDIVHSAHTLEHISRAECGTVLDEWIRVLAPGGELRINVPSLEWVAKQILAGKLGTDELNVLYGQQEYAENYHQNGFTTASLTALLKEKGLTEQQVTHKGYNLIVQARRAKPDGVDRQPRRVTRTSRKPRR